MKKYGLIFLTILTACASVEITQPPILVTPTDSAAAVGIDVYARDRARGNPVPRFRGQVTVPVRTFGNIDGSGYGEIAGAACLLDSGLYRAEFVTPANIGVPNYGPESPAIFVRCEANGLSGSLTVDAYNLTNAQRTSGAAGAGLLGAIIIGAVAADAMDPNTDQFDYPPLGVQLQ